MIRVEVRDPAINDCFGVILDGVVHDADRHETCGPPTSRQPCVTTSIELPGSAVDSSQIVIVQSPSSAWLREC